MRETFSQRVFLALCGDDAGAERVPSASAEAADGVGTFLPHLSLLGAVQSRQLGEFLDGKGICRLVSSDKPQAVECAILARQQLMGGGKLVRLSQLQTGIPKDGALPSIQEDHELHVEQHSSKAFARDWVGHSMGADETTSTRSPLTSPDIRDPSILGEDESGVKPPKKPSGPLATALRSVQLFCNSIARGNTCGSHFSSCIDVIPGRSRTTGVFNAEAMQQVVGVVQREDIAVICATLEELNSCLQALEQWGAFQGDNVQVPQKGGTERCLLAIPGQGLLRALLASCGLPYEQNDAIKPPCPLPPPGSVWEVQLRRDAETLQIVEAHVKAQAKTDYLSRACTHMWESKTQGAIGAADVPLSVMAVRERLESDVAALADPEGFVALDEAATLGAVYGATPTMEDLRKWEQERGRKVNLKDMHLFINTFKSRDNLADLAAPFARVDREKTGHISRMLFLTLLGMAGDEAATDDQIATLFRLYGLSFGETVNYLEFISRVTDGCELLELGSFIDPEGLSSRREGLGVENPRSHGDRSVSRSWSCRDNIQSLLSGASLRAYSPSTASAAAVPRPERELLIKPHPVTGKVGIPEVLALLSAEGTEALPEDVSAFLAEVPAASEGLDATLLSALQQFAKFRHTRFSEATNGLGWLHITDAEGLFEDFSFDELPHKLECRQFQRKLGTPQLHYSDFLAFGEFVAKRREEFHQRAKAEGTGDKVTLSQGIVLARLWGFSPTLAQTAAMQRQLNEKRKQPQNEGSLVGYEELLQLLSAIPHVEGHTDDLSLLFRHFDAQETGVLPAKVIRHLLSTFGEPLDEEEVDSFFKYHHIEATGRVAYSELVEAALAQ